MGVIVSSRKRTVRFGIILLVSLLMLAIGTPADARRKRKRRKRRRRKPVPVQPAPKVPEAAKPDEPAPAPEPKKPAGPWAVGVTAQQKSTARALLAEGNKLYLANNFKEAVAKYKEALKAWDHPAIRINMVNALMGVNQYLEAYDNLEKGLKYGQAPMEESVYRNALTLQISLVALVATINISCDTAGASVGLDGQPVIATCPGKATKRVLPGRHQLVAQKAGYLTLTEDVVLMPGKAKDVPVKMISLKAATKTRRRWKTWKPWGVFGAGIAVAGIGGLLQLKSQSDFDGYGEDIARLCSDKGCTPDQIPNSVSGRESRARLENQMAVGSMIAGGALVVGGVIMALMNRPKSYLPESAGKSNRGVKTSIAITPRGGYVGLGLDF